MSLYPVENFYDVLELEPDCEPEAIKRAWRKLAMRWHPDRNPGEAATLRFQLVQRAYEVLSDPPERSRYDLWLEQNGRRRPRFHDFSREAERNAQRRAEEAAAAEAARATARASARAARREGPRGRDRRRELPVTLAEQLSGCTRRLLLNPANDCAHCGGRGGRVETVEVRCGRCDAGCPACGHTGLRLHARWSSCAHCEGPRDATAGPRRVSVDVPPGVADGEIIRVTGEGERPEDGPPGDLLLTVRLAPHPLFEVQHPDLLCTVPLPLVRALAGGPLHLPTPTGPLTVDLAPGQALSGVELRLPGHGLRLDRRANPVHRGDLRVRFEPVSGHPLDAEQLALLRAVADRQERDPQRPARLREWEAAMITLATTGFTRPPDTPAD